MNLKNKKILITGGSRGIGASIAKEMIIHGGEVAITFKENEPVLASTQGVVTL
jgi:3-oxoacyl-[acyl-carrier protein] reductase